MPVVLDYELDPRNILSAFQFAFFADSAKASSFAR